jgi:DNA repair protein RecO (recombination protein O)
MSRTYKATGINLKSMPLGEADRLVTILTREFGLVRAVAPGARKQNSKLGGRSALFVVNELLVAKGRSLDKITQAETLESYPGLGKDLSKLAASQYLAELVICQALTDQPQEDLYAVLNEHLRRLEQLPKSATLTAAVLAHLSHGIFHLLALAGIAPQVHLCCLTQQPLIPNFIDPEWRVGFSVEAGGAISLSGLSNAPVKVQLTPAIKTAAFPDSRTAQKSVVSTSPPRTQIPPKLNAKLNALELALLQQLASAELTELETLLPQLTNSSTEPPATAWFSIERILRQYTQYHLGCSIRSAALMDTFLSG